MTELYDDWVYVGSYAREEEPGIHVFGFERGSGTLTPLQALTGVANPSFLAINEEDRCVYAVSETEAAFSGVVTLVARADGSLKIHSAHATNGSAPCHASWLPKHRAVIATNYGGGNVTLFPVDATGILLAASDNVWHEGQGVSAERQEAPHPHSAFPDVNERFVLVQDLGVDKVVVYAVEGSPPRLRQHAEVEIQPGAGPRHIAFHPSGRYAYLINELDNTVMSFTYNSEKGHLTLRQTLSTLPDGFDGTSYCAHIQVSPDGRFVYGSNRGHDSIVVFQVDPDDGSLTYVQHVSTEGHWPRHFNISPDGAWLLVANERSDNIVAFQVNRETGHLQPSGRSWEIQKPVCIQFGKVWS
ncbi:MAG: lactonase family protein [Alicyclobacillus sp.]|nr:lactonase family protein [Alicyclobacillus sp.]